MKYLEKALNEFEMKKAKEGHCLERDHLRKIVLQ
jgi:hypothetical protein